MTPKKQRPRPVRQPSKAQYRNHNHRHFTKPPSLEKIESALSAIPADDRETWLKIGMALKAELGEDGFTIWAAWSQQAPCYRERDARDVWKSIKSGTIGIGTLFHLASNYGWRPGLESMPLSSTDIEARHQLQETDQLKREADAARRHQAAAAKARLIWSRAAPCMGHPYLSRKRVKAHGLRFGTWEKRYQDENGVWQSTSIEGAFLVPMRDAAGTLWNLQAIFPEPHPILGRDKDFLAGARKAGLFHIIGGSTDTILIAEGYATAATIHEATGHQTYAALDCGNLMAVARVVRDRHPGQRITLCADNDRHTPGNPGVTKANAAARAIGGLVSVPTFPDGVPGTDWNDLHLYRLERKEVGHGI